MIPFKPGPANKHQCEVCLQALGLYIGPLGLHANTWSDRFHRWFDACTDCAWRIRYDNKERVWS